MNTTAKSTRYHGKPCKHGHGTERHSSSGGCVICQKVASRAWNKRPENRAKQKAARQRYKAKPGVMARDAAHSRRYNATPRGKMLSKNRVLKKLYAMTIEAYQELLVKQAYLCAICKKHADTFPVALAVDHCHNTNRVRGLLCGNCNKGIGNLQDDPIILMAAVEYVRAGT